MPKMVRIKPYDPQMGQVVRRYTVSAWETRFEEYRGWYLVPDEWADYLATLHQQANNAKSPKLFDVCTVAQAKGIEAEEKAVERVRAETDAPIAVGGAQDALAGALTSADLPKMSPPVQPPPLAKPAPSASDDGGPVSASSSMRRSKRTS